jgi:SAM-dependent methyltransferase
MSNDPVTNTLPPARCWCGNADLVPFSPHYQRCEACETLVAVRRPLGDITKVQADEQGLYGRDYWFGHQEQDVGLPNIESRAKSDLSERDLHWLATVLKYKLPPATVQELGSAHGGFVALLRWAGYDATGLELSPWIVEYARKTFGVPMLLGPLEAQPIEPLSLDVLALMDVMEHLPDPVATMGHGLKLLKPDGVAIVQTPAYPQGVSYQQLVERDDYFLNHMRGKHEEHLFLFSRRSARELFTRLGCAYIEFEPAIFSQYDMYFVVSRLEPRRATAARIDEALESTPGGRLVQALLETARKRDDYLREATARLKVIEALAAEVERLRDGR